MDDSRPWYQDGERLGAVTAAILLTVIICLLYFHPEMAEGAFKSILS